MSVKAQSWEPCREQKSCLCVQAGCNPGLKQGGNGCDKGDAIIMQLLQQNLDIKVGLRPSGNERRPTGKGQEDPQPRLRQS